jgi:hypothetical protein
VVVFDWWKEVYELERSVYRYVGLVVWDGGAREMDSVFVEVEACWGGVCGYDEGTGIHYLVHCIEEEG